LYKNNSINHSETVPDYVQAKSLIVFERVRKMTEDYKFFTYKEAAIALSSTVESVRVLARRHQWPKRKNNLKQVIVGVPVERLNHSGTISENVMNDNAVHDLQKQVAILATELKYTTEKVANLKQQCSDLRQDRDAWREQAQRRHWWRWKKTS